METYVGSVLFACFLSVLWPACEVDKVPFCLMKLLPSLPFPLLLGNMKRSSQATSRSYRRSPRPCENGLPSGGSSMWWEDGAFVGVSFNGRIIALYFVGLCHTSAWITTGVTYVRSFLKRPLPPLTPSFPCGLSQHWVELGPTTHSHWLSILRVVMCMFPYCSLNSCPPFPPRPLPSPLLCPHFCFLYLCLPCCPADRFISSVFLESMRAKSLQCLGLCNPVDCSPPGSSVHGILQARILQWVAMPSFWGSSQPRDQSRIS